MINMTVKQIAKNNVSLVNINKLIMTNTGININISDINNENMTAFIVEKVVTF